MRSGNTTALKITTIVALLILLIAIANYINISISILLKRIKEVAVRKVMGASKNSLRMQFLAESTFFL